MVVDAAAPPTTNGTVLANKPVELAIELPQSPGMRVNLHLTTLENSILLFLTSTSAEAGQGAASMGSFVYAMPDVRSSSCSDPSSRTPLTAAMQRYNPSQPVSTALYTVPSSLDFTTRMAKVLCRRLQKPCYVGCSINLSGAAGGGTVDEEMEAFRTVVEVVTTGASR